MLAERTFELLRELVGIESITFHEEEATRYLSEHLTKMGFRVETDGCNNVIAELRGNGGGKRLMYLGHHDTVEVGDPALWRHPPFSATLEDGLIYGRGTNDEKGGIAACLAAIEALQAEHPQGFAGDILFVSAREETLDIETRGVMEVLKREIVADGCICLEPTSCQVILGQKGRSIVDITTKGKAAHGATPECGVNAISHMAHLIREIDAIPLPVAEPLGAGTQCIGTIKGGIRANMVPPECTISIDRRTVMGETTEGVMADYTAAAARVKAAIPEFEAEISIRPPFHPACTNVSEEIVVQAKQACEALGVPYETGYFVAHTDAEWIINDAGIPSIILGPGDIGTAHSANEFVPQEELTRCARLYYTIMKQMLL